MRSDGDRRRSERLTLAFLASLLVHALLAYFLFSLTIPASQQASESISGWQQIITVTSRSRLARTRVVKASSRTRTVLPPHPRVLHELAKYAPTAPPNPTPVPLPSAAPTSVPTTPVLPSPVPVAAAPTALPAVPSPAPATVPPTIAPSPKPPAPRPTVAVPPSATPGVPSPAPTAAATASARAVAPTSAPRAVATSGPGAAVASRQAVAPRPVQVPPATPRPIPAHTARPRQKTQSVHQSLNARLRSLIPTSAPPTPEPPKMYRALGNLRPAEVPEPTPPPDVLAATKYLYEEDAHQAFSELRIKMYVTKVRKVGFVTVCTGWLLRYPFPPAHGTYRLDSNFNVAPKPEIEPGVTYVCNARNLKPYAPGSPAPTASP